MKQILFLASNFIISAYCFSQAGFLDETFGNNGRVYTNLEGYCYAIALQADGKILAGGADSKDGSDRRILVRYLPDGEVDESFGKVGIVTLPGFTSMRTIQVLEDGKILAGGAIAPNIATAKLKSDGTLDSTFGKDGIFSSDIGGNAVLYAMQVQPDGKILLGGRLQVFEYTYKMVLVRVNADGSSLDESFAANGKVINNAGYQFNCLAVQENGKILAGGQLWPTGHGDRDMFYISRYKSDGSPDESFGTNGSVFTDITADGNDVLNDVSVLNDGKIVAGGIAHYLVSTNESYMAAVKYNSDGTMDESFGENGIKKITFENISSEATGLLVQLDGKLILTGSVYESSGRGDFALARLKPDGLLDSSFGINGKQITEIGDYARAHASILQGDGKIILAGDAGTSYDYALARYNNDIVMPLHFTYFNATSTNNGGIALNWQTAQENNNAYFAVERSGDSRFRGNDGTSLEITRINSKGNSSQAQTYSYTDNAPLQGTNFYRLKQVDKDGRFSYSQIVSVTLQNGLFVILYPNPVKDVLNIKGLSSINNYELIINNSGGNVMVQTSISNASSYMWNLQRLSKGIYYLSLVSNNKTTTVKFVKE